jgi:alpha-L-fucosidase
MQGSCLEKMPRAVFALLVACSFVAFVADAQNFADAKPSPQQVEWQDLEFGVIIHFGLNTFQDREWGDGTASPQLFDPSEFEPQQWMRAIKAAGAKYVILVAKHHDGFCLWPTSQTEYSVRTANWRGGKGDVVGEVAAAAKKYGLKFGIYLSPWDRHEPRYQNSADYDKYYSAQVEELAQNYGELIEFWLDGAGSAGHVYNFPKFIEVLRTYQPNTLVFADTGLFEYGDVRWAGNEEGIIQPDNWNVVDRHGYLRWRPAEADTPLRKKHWFWHPNDEVSLKLLVELTDIYERTVGRGGQLVLGLAPDRRGLLPDSDVKRLEELGGVLQRRYAANLSAKQHVRGNDDTERALDNDRDTFWSAPQGSHHSILEVDFPKPVMFDQALTMERLNDGQHIQTFRVEIWKKDRWEPVVAGRTIGHKRIDVFAPRTASRVRLNILNSTAAAEIREFQLFFTGEQ